jgi:hypothetical protein
MDDFTQPARLWHLAAWTSPSESLTADQRVSLASQLPDLCDPTAKREETAL